MIRKTSIKITFKELLARAGLPVIGGQLAVEQATCFGANTMVEYEIEVENCDPEYPFVVLSSQGSTDGHLPSDEDHFQSDSFGGPEREHGGSSL